MTSACPNPYCGSVTFVFSVITATGRFVATVSSIHSPVNGLLASPSWVSVAGSYVSVSITWPTSVGSGSWLTCGAGFSFPQPANNAPAQIVAKAQIHIFFFIMSPFRFPFYLLSAQSTQDIHSLQYLSLLFFHDRSFLLSHMIIAKQMQHTM